jgi:hypothetical protein
MRLVYFSQLVCNGAELLLTSLRFWNLSIASHLKTKSVLENISVPIHRRNGGKAYTHLGPTGKLFFGTEQPTWLINGPFCQTRGVNCPSNFPQGKEQINFPKRPFLKKYDTQGPNTEYHHHNCNIRTIAKAHNKAIALLSVSLYFIPHRVRCYMPQHIGVLCSCL